jgi:hypothetical protein
MWVGKAGLPPEQQVGGSNPSRRTIINDLQAGVLGHSPRL